MSVTNEYSNKNSAIAEGLRDALCQLKSYQLLHHCMKNCTSIALQQLNDLEGHSRSS